MDEYFSKQYNIKVNNLSNLTFFQLKQILSDLEKGVFEFESSEFVILFNIVSNFVKYTPFEIQFYSILQKYAFILNEPEIFNLIDSYNNYKENKFSISNLPSGIQPSPDILFFTSSFVDIINNETNSEPKEKEDISQYIPKEEEMQILSNLSNLLTQISPKLPTRSPVIQEICKILLGNYSDKFYPQLYSILLQTHQMNEIAMLGILKEYFKTDIEQTLTIFCYKYLLLPYLLSLSNSVSRQFVSFISSLNKNNEIIFLENITLPIIRNCENEQSFDFLCRLLSENHLTSQNQILLKELIDSSPIIIQPKFQFFQYLLSQNIDISDDIIKSIINIFDQTSLNTEYQTNQKFCNILFSFIKNYKMKIKPYKQSLVSILNRCKAVVIKPALAMLNY